MATTTMLNATRTPASGGTERTTMPSRPSARCSIRARTPRRLARLLPVIALALTLPLGGCGAFNWLGGEKDPTPPTKLPKAAPTEVSIRTLWKTRIGRGSDGRALALVPAVSGGRVYVAEARGRVAALSASDGRAVWERDLRLRFSGGPDVAGEHVALGTSNGQVVLLSTRDGSQRWQAQLQSEVLSVPRIVGDLVVVHTIDDSIYGLALADGSERWRFNVPAPVLTLRGSSSPVIAGDGVIVGLSGGRLVHLELAAGAPLWEVVVTPPTGRSELDRIADLDVDPVVEGDIAYVATYNGDLAAVDILLGSVLWRRSLSAHAGLASDGEVLYITDSADHLWAAEPGDGTGLWRQEALAYRRLSGPAIAGNAIVVGDLDGFVHWLSRRDGRLLGFERVTKGRIRAAPVVSNNIVFVYADDGTVAALSTSGASARGPAASTPTPGPQRAPPTGTPNGTPTTDDAPRPLPVD